MTITYTSPFWFSLIVVIIIMFIINYLAKAFILKEKGKIISLSFIFVLLIQSLVITVILEFI